MSGMRVSLKQTECVLDGVNQRPVENKQMLSRAAREDNGRHRLAVGSALSQLAAELLQRHTVALGEFFESGFDLGKRD